jgi:gas vesicle protein GvpO
MTRGDKATLRAEGRERRRRPSHDDAPQEEQPSRENGRRDEKPRAKQEPPRGAGGDELAEIATQARELLRSLRGVEAESVSAIGRTQNGWRVALEVVELRRIPDSTDVLASYEVELDGDGKFLGFERGRRYNRSQAEGVGR